MPENSKQPQLPLKGQLIALAVIGLVAVVGIAFGFLRSQIQSPVQPTVDPLMRANLTALPTAPMPSEAELQQFGGLRHQFLTCVDYSAARRDQMLQHITWLENPQQIPPDITYALTLGGPINNRLIYGMAIFTSTEWRLLQRPAKSCLIEIGMTLNDMLAVLGDAPITIYDE